MQASDNFRQFLQSCSRALSSRANAPETIAGADYLASRVASAPARDYTPQSQPVLASLTKLQHTDFAAGFHAVASEMPWRRSSRTTDEGRITALGAINEMLDLGDLVAGLLYLDSQRQYPLHQHSPQELYLILSGVGRWRYGGAESYQTRQPGDIIYNRPNDLHGIQAGREPLLALYLLWPDQSSG